MDISPVEIGNARAILEQGRFGILVVKVDSQMDIERLDFDGPTRFSMAVPYSGDQSVIFTPLPPGEFELTAIHVKLPVSVIRYRPYQIVRLDIGDLVNQPFKFVVEAGQLNYLGDLQVGDVYFDRGSDDFQGRVDVVNRSSFMYSYLQQHAPQLAARFPIRYAGFGTDGFFAEIKRLGARQQVSR